MGQSAGSIRAGGAYVELHGKDDKLKETLKGNESGVSKWGNRISQISEGVGRTFAKGLAVVSTASVAATGAAVGVVGGFISAAKSFEQNAERLSRLPKTGISSEDLKSARQLRLAMSTLSTSITAAWAQVGAAVAPVVTKVINWASKIVQGFTRWAASNRQLIATTAQMAVRIAAWSAAIFVAVKGLVLIGGIVAFLVANPLVGLIAALVAGVAAWLSFTSSGQAAFGGIKGYVGSVVAWLQERFGALYKDFQTAWSGIVAAVSKGDLSTAAEIVWLTLKLAFFETVKALGGNWNKFYSAYLKTVALIGDAWDFLFTRITQGFDIAFTKLKQGWRGTQTFLAKGISYIIGVIEGKTAEERQQVFNTLNQMHEEETAKSNTELEDRVKAQEAKMKKSMAARAKALQKELDSLPASDQQRINQLRQQLQSLATQAAEGSPDKPQFYAPRNIATAGTFNAAAIRGVAGGNVMDEIKVNTKETAKNTKATAQAVAKHKGPTFGMGAN
ncbi:MAG: phage tail tape measure protein [Rhizobium sp.]|nr:MAG: phage tail tape measure protein [Rhizobium sp.]